MAKEKKFYQCKLSRTVETKSGDLYQRKTAWIPEEGAKVGLEVELLPEREFWKVDCVFNNYMSESQITDVKRLNRKSLPSVEPMG